MSRQRPNANVHADVQFRHLYSALDVRACYAVAFAEAG